MTPASDGDGLAAAAKQFREAFHSVFHASTEYPRLAELWTLLGESLASWDAGRELREAEREYLEANEAVHEHERSGTSPAWDKIHAALKGAARELYDKLLAARKAKP